MTDPVEDIIGDYRAFATLQRDRLLERGIEISPFGMSHLCFRVPEYDEYIHVRNLLERHARANRESVWNGRPMSLIMLKEPLDLVDGKRCDRIELIPPVHQRVYKMGLEHIGFVVGDGYEGWIREHRSVLTGQQFQSANVDPVYILMEDWTHVKFYRRSFIDVVQDEGGPIEGFTHVEGWVPQRILTATHADLPPR